MSKKRKIHDNGLRRILISLMMFLLIAVPIAADAAGTKTGTAAVQEQSDTVTLANLPAYAGTPFVAVNDNVPYFTADELVTTSFETYSELDKLGRCGAAYASVGQDLMPTEERGSIGQVKPTGWHTVKYPDIIPDRYLYNRCHLIGYQLTGENANEKNLITGTRYMNVDGMLPFEDMVADYVKETGNHVLYRVTPVFTGKNLVADGVLMEAESVEDAGEGVLFNVFVYNVQPGIVIDYATGESSVGQTPAAVPAAAPASAKSGTEKAAVTNTASAKADTAVPVGTTYILNTSTHKFHLPSCASVKQMKEKNKEVFTGSRDEVIAKGYKACKNCNP